MNRRRFLLTAAVGPFYWEAGGSAAATQTVLPTAVRESFGASEEPAYLSNGIVGFRPGAQPLEPCLHLVSGFVGRHARYGIETLVPAPDPLAAELSVVSADGSEQRLILTPRRQTLEFRNGELTTELLAKTPNGQNTFEVRVLDLAPRGTPSLRCPRIEILGSGTVRIRTRIDAAGAQGTTRALPGFENREVDSVTVTDSPGDLSRLGIAVALVPALRARRTEYGGAVDLTPETGRPGLIEMLSASVPSLYHPDPALQAIRMASWARMLGVDRIRQQNDDAWNRLWKGRIEVDAPSGVQRVLDEAHFYLHSSLHPSTLTGMPPFGLSQWQHYYGHSFWDTETWSFLPVLLTAPDAARALLEFRLRGLPNAQRLARLFGFRGAQFPWEAGMLNGSETTPVFAATGWAEQHVVPDVALAFWKYYLATQDREFLHRGTWPVLREVAAWITSRGEWTSRGYEIRNIMGPDEGAGNLSNSAYVTVACQTALRAAMECAPLVGEEAPRLWEDTASRLILPMDGRGVPLTWEGAVRSAFPDFAFLLPFDPQLPAGALEKAFEAFRLEKRHQHTIGFATAAQAAAAARLGNRELATELFDAAWRPFRMEPFGLIREAESQTYGCFITDFGALLQAVLTGFAGLSIAGEKKDWTRYPATLPSGWKSLHVNTIFVHGLPHSLDARPGSPSKLTPAKI